MSALLNRKMFYLWTDFNTIQNSNVTFGANNQLAPY